MALNPSTSVASRDLALNAAFDVLNSGKAGGFDGTQPTNANTAIGAQVKLFECALSATAFAASSSASKAANSITADSSPDATGTLAWCSFYASSRATTGTHDCSAGTSGANINFNTLSIVSAVGSVSITSFTVTQAT